MSINKTNTNVPFIHHELINEWDIRSANTSLMRYYNLASSKLISKLEKMEKRDREPYGWANYETREIKGVKYEMNIHDLVLSTIFAETIIVPVLITGYDLFEPVSYIESDTTNINKGIE